jgi:N-glycosylase/DNA lyase
MNTWARILKDQLVVLSIEEGNVFYQTSGLDARFLNEYFNLGVDLMSISKAWPSLSVRATNIRVIFQDPFETIVSFLCSQNNGILRITKMVHSLMRHYGKLAFTVRSDKDYDLFTFPRPEHLLDSEEVLKTCLGFGYRSRYIQGTCRILADKPLNYMETLGSLPYPQLIQELLIFPGVGPKVADCIALIGFRKFEAVPIDTHILQVARKMGLVDFKSLTPKAYIQLADKFRAMFGPYSGWAQCILFAKQLGGHQY